MAVVRCHSSKLLATLCRNVLQSCPRTIGSTSPCCQQGRGPLVPLDLETVRKKPQDLEYIPQHGPMEVGAVSGIPEEHIKTRHVRIYVPAKNTMQSGTTANNCWRIQFDNRERWENPLMGWASTADPVSNTEVDFTTAEAAMAFCERYGYEYHVEEPKLPKRRPKSYAANFAWDKKTRKSCK